MHRFIIGGTLVVAAAIGALAQSQVAERKVSRATLSVHGDRLYLEVCGVVSGRGGCEDAIELKGADKVAAQKFLAQAAAPIWAKHK